MTDTGTFGPIGDFLRAPQEIVTLGVFSERFRARRIELRLRNRAAEAEDPGLIGRIRGAYGIALMAGASRTAIDGQPCPWLPPCAFEILFRKQGRMTSGTDYPDPWVLSAAPSRGHLTVAMTIFGMATDYAAVAAEALTSALVHQVRWHGQGKPEIMAREYRIPAVQPPRPDVRHATLEFVTPLVVSAGHGVAEQEPHRAFAGLGLRLEGLARWHGLALSHDWRGFSDALQALDMGWDDVEPVTWTRGSKRQGRSIAMHGVRGRLVITGPADALTAILPALTLGEVVHIGADIVFGCGCYRLTLR